MLIGAGVLRRSRGASQPVRQRVFLVTGVSLAVFQNAYFGAVQNTGPAVGTIVTLGAAPVFTATAGRLLLGGGRYGTAWLRRIRRGGYRRIAGELAAWAETWAPGRSPSTRRALPWREATSLGWEANPRS